MTVRVAGSQSTEQDQKTLWESVFPATQATGTLIREYVWLNWEPIAVIEGGVNSFVRTDHIGRPVFATNTSGVKVWTTTPACEGLRGRSSGKQSTGLFSDPPHPFGGDRTTTGTRNP